jgi:hypothetical protein
MLHQRDAPASNSTLLSITPVALSLVLLLDILMVYYSTIFIYHPFPESSSKFLLIIITLLKFFHHGWASAVALHVAPSRLSSRLSTA